MPAPVYEPPIPITLPAPGPARRARRGAETVAVFTRNLGPVLANRARGATVGGAETGRRLRQAFERLGSTYVKFGQLIGSSPGAFGQEVSDEFRSCLDAGPPVPFPLVRQAVERTTGRPLLEVFSTFEETPVAAASIAVVHRAVLADGRVVAVKVLRPGIAAAVATDLDIMAPLFRRLALQGVPIAGPLYRFLTGFRVQVAEELDLRNEARAMAHFAHLYAEAGLAIVVPTPEPALSGRDVLVMDFLDGVPIDDLSAIESLGHDPTPLVRELLRSWFLTGLRHGRFHGDIHAGNLMLLRDGRLGLLDWGIVGRLDGPTHRLFRRFVEAVLGDQTAWPEVAAFLREMAPVPGLTDGDRLSAEAQDDIERVLTRPFGQVDLTGAFRGGGGPGVPRRTARPTRAERRQRRARLRELRQHVIGSGFSESQLAQANFLLFKQLLYFERYGKLYLADESLLGDREWLTHVLATSPAPSG